MTQWVLWDKISEDSDCNFFFFFGFIYGNCDVSVEHSLLQFSKEGGKVIDEHKLKVVYTSSAQSGNGNSEGESGLASAASGRRGSDVRPTLTYLFNVFFFFFSFQTIR